MSLHLNGERDSIHKLESSEHRVCETSQCCYTLYLYYWNEAQPIEFED